MGRSLSWPQGSASALGSSIVMSSTVLLRSGKRSGPLVLRTIVSPARRNAREGILDGWLPMPLQAQCGLVLVAFDGSECTLSFSPHTVDVWARVSELCQHSEVS